MGYALPTNTDFVSCSWQCHKNRNPPSSEPGTDYGVAYGAPLYAPGNGVVYEVKTSNSNATGRYITIDMDDGRRTRSLHLSTISVSKGQRVGRGQQIGKTGASANGSDWGVGAHVHQTLWPTHAYVFGPNGTLDFAKYVGPDSVAPNQRVVGGNGANGRKDPSTKNPATQTLPPGTVADFNGWINGETVEGNRVWFRGMHSGDFFWSGGFTDKGTHDLTDLNAPPPIQGNQRVAGQNGANARNEPNTSGPVVDTLAPGAVGTFDGWINGETVEGNKVWFRGKTSQKWYWSGGFTDKGTHDLTDLNPPPTPTPTRTVGANTANVRNAPYTTATVIGSEASGAVVQMDAWATGDTVEGNSTWFRRASDDAWLWSGGFTSQSTEGLVKVTPPPKPSPPDADNPRGLPVVTSPYPRTYMALSAPLGFTDCQNPVTPSPRDYKGNPPQPTSGVIDRFIVHYTAVTNDQLDYFSYCNDRSVCPSFYLRTNGQVFQMVRPGSKAATTGPEWNWRAIAVETQCLTPGPEGKVTDIQLEEISQMIAWLAEYDGKVLDGAPVSFKIDRTHVISHKEALPGTECPGNYITARMDAIVERALVIYEEKHPPIQPDPDAYIVPKELGDQIRTLVEQAFPED